MFKFFSAMLFLVTALSATAGDFAVERDAEGLRIVPQSEHAGAVVTIDGPEAYRSLRFGANEDIFIPVPEQDGRFTYEVTLTPVISEAGRRRITADRDAAESIVGDSSARKTSGGFEVAAGALVTDTTEATGDTDITPRTPVDGPQPLATVLANDDGVIRTNLCVGNDCPNAPAFGADTIRLQENNLHIHFDDTSTAGTGFPDNDWRLVANEQNSGQRNLFAIEDATAGRFIAAFEAGAPANSLYVADNGNIGVGTSTPGGIELNIADGDTPALRLNQDGSAGFTPQTFDLASNEANLFIRDVTNGSSLVLRIQPGADDNSLTIDNEGQVGIGMPGQGMPEASATLQVRARNVAGDDVIRFQDNAGDDLMVLDTDGDLTLTGTLAQLSRRDSKEHFSPVDHRALLATLKGLPISTWNYRHQPAEQRHIGPVAEDFHAAYGLGESPEHIAASDMAAVALAASQALVREVEARDDRIAELEDRLARMEVMVHQLMHDRGNEAAPTLTAQ